MRIRNFFLLLLMCWPGFAAAQQRWQLSPYPVKVWLAFDPSLGLTAENQQAFRSELQQLAESYSGPVWDVHVEAVPVTAQGDVTARLDQLRSEQIFAKPHSPGGDATLFVLLVSSSDGALQIRGRQFQGLTGYASALLSRDVPETRWLSQAGLSLMFDLFTPVVHLTDIHQDVAEARLRAAGLATDSNSPALVHSGDILQPVIRRKDRLGRSRPGQSEVVSWTLLTVEQREGAAVRCRIHSAHRKPLAGRASLRIQRYAVLVRPTWPATRLLLRAAGGNQPLSGYEIIEGVAGGSQSQSLGFTDFDGAMLIPRDRTKLRILYVRHGDQLLARLPMLPGQSQEMTATLGDDDIRLEAESLVARLKREVIDVAARRQLLAHRIQRRIQDGKFDEAADLLRDLHELPSRRDFLRQLQLARGDLSSENQVAQQRIEALFASAEQQLARYLDPRVPQQLQDQLTRAKSTP